MLMSYVLCKCGIHKWTYFADMAGAYGVFRQCQRCGMKQRWLPISGEWMGGLVASKW